MESESGSWNRGREGREDDRRTTCKNLKREHFAVEGWVNHDHAEKNRQRKGGSLQQRTGRVAGGRCLGRNLTAHSMNGEEGLGEFPADAEEEGLRWGWAKEQVKFNSGRGGL